MARALYSERNTLVGVVQRAKIEGYRGEDVALFPTLPIGEQRHHLAWLQNSLDRYDEFLERISSHASRAVDFEPHPKGFVFFTTATPSYPSAYCWDGFIGYNVLGPLHSNAREMHETLFHELFHLNDARRGTWSIVKLGPLYASIVDRCRGDEACLETFAPHPSLVPNGTFYAFDARTGDVREYAAELALRYFLEHEAVFDGRPQVGSPFKCGSRENEIAWNKLADDFFGGVDLTPPCTSEHGGT